MNKNVILITLGVVLLAAVGAVWFFATHHQVTSNEWKGLQGPAKYDKYYIAERFLQQKGLQVTREETYARMNDEAIDHRYDTVFLSNSGRTMSEAQRKTLLDWVANGGHLVIQGETANYTDWGEDTDNAQRFEAKAQSNRDLLSQAGIAVADCENDICRECRTSEEAGQRIDAVSEAVSHLSGDQDYETDEEKADELLRVDSASYNNSTIELNGKKLVLGNSDRHGLFAHGGKAKKIFSQPASCTGDLFALFTYGRGQITVYNQSTDAFSNRIGWWGRSNSIFGYHNATYLYYLLTAADQSGQSKQRILWYESETYPGIWGLVWQYWRYAAIAAVALLLAWIWRNTPRFGSLLVEDERKGLTLNRHLRATGQFYYQNDGKSLLASACYEQLDKDIARHIPLAKRLSQRQLAEKIADKTGLAAAVVNEVLERRYPQSDNEFTQLIYTIQQIRNRL